ncbi:DUF2062 domain-containing protein [Noviherbaspirillum sp.]|uniref:DUF2062 domain-containing protein n=1 Tax=Noviherbaspirillum sp. TaxID=1926288 RepID=UPI002FDF989E
MKPTESNRKPRRPRRWKQHIPTQESILTYRALKPVHRFLDHHCLWQFNRRSVAGGAAVGLFFAIAFPIAQIPLAAIAAILFKVNLPVAVFGTLLSNPFTTPALLYLAYQLGAFLVGGDPSDAAAVANSQAAVFDYSNFGSLLEWMRHSLTWIQSVGMSLITGLVVLSVLLSIFGYVAVHAIWRFRSVSRWRTRCTERSRTKAGCATEESAS